MCLVVLAGPGYTELVRYSFNFLGGPTSRLETLDASGIVRGTFNYLDSQGHVKVQHYDYTAQVGSPAVNFIEPAQAPADFVPLQPVKPTPEHAHEAPETAQKVTEPTQEAPEPTHDTHEVALETPGSTSSTPKPTSSTPKTPTEPPKSETIESPQDASDAPFRVDFKSFGQRLRALARFSHNPHRPALRASRNK